jgi:CubicO group peptidase (beta-lactamase class C family)
MQQQHIIGLSVGIVSQGQVVLRKGYGLANVEQAVAASSASIYKIGSISKQIVATAIMLLVQEGKLHLTDTLPQFFPGAPSAWHSITIRQLLNHTSGLPRDSPVLDNMKQQPDPILIRGAYKSPLLFAPGTQWRYCNLGYFMLADIIRQRTHQPFATFMQEQLFAKYALLHTRTTTFSTLVPHRVAGYVYKEGEGFSNAKDYLALRPSRAFLSSIDDLLDWELLIQHQQVLSKKNWELMWTDTVRTSTTRQDPLEYYGYGWDVSTYQQRRIVHHDGTIPGFTGSYFRFVDSNTAIIVLTNADNAYPKTVALRIADLLFPKHSAR